MVDEGVRPDRFVLPKVYKACAELKDYGVGKEVYDYMLDIGFEGNHWVKRRDFSKALKCINDMKVRGVFPDRVTWNSIIAGYAHDGQLKEAQKCFMEMSRSEGLEANVVSWTALITGHEQNGFSAQALNIFKKMVITGIKPNSVTIASVVSACSNLSLSRYGKEIHGYCIKKDVLDSDFSVANSLLDFYSKCQSLDVARLKFSKIKRKDLVSWNAMLAGYAIRGSREDAVKLLQEMELQGIEPNTITWNGLIMGFTQYGDGKAGLAFFYMMREMATCPNRPTISGALAVCGQLQDMKLGKEIHSYVIRNKIELSTGVGSALISMYSACGSLKLACSVFNELPIKDVVIWHSIIAACA
ncbi:hypothetical protein RJ640_018170 [Escallonia rubra]|uniref:Pentatricopeptide repeat-containing protein n=1 Tax=Escallonia rubra TaxID=112253 RepID=A0AA88UNW3_9ASTE|nr:hypothetical protein RJ640_018170 [Escallonia rubra]